MLKTFRVPRSPQGKRLLAFLKEKLEAPTKELRWLVEHHHCQVNGNVERFCSTKLYGGEKITLNLSKRKKEGFQPKAIVFEDSAFIVYNKPAHLTTEQLVESSGLHCVHRLDRGTSGLLILAKTEEALHAFELLFKERKIEKRYLAAVQQAPSEPQGKITASLEVASRREGAILMRTTEKGGFKSVTHYKVVAQTPMNALIQCSPLTGRTHQIRVHLASIGSPILGDVDYNSRQQRTHHTRPLLHAWRLHFNHPFYEKPLTFEAPLPEDFPKGLRLGVSSCTPSI